MRLIISLIRKGAKSGEVMREREGKTVLLHCQYLALIATLEVLSAVKAESILCFGVWCE